MIDERGFPYTGHATIVTKSFEKITWSMTSARIPSTRIWRAFATWSRSVGPVSREKPARPPRSRIDVCRSSSRTCSASSFICLMFRLIMGRRTLNCSKLLMFICGLDRCPGLWSPDLAASCSKMTTVFLDALGVRLQRD
jgi:hypothetical protein